MPQEPKPLPNPNKIGFVVKYWPNNGGYTSVLINTAHLLRKSGYLVTVFLFEKSHDLPLLDEFKDFEIQVWCPESRSLVDYINLLAESSLLVTSRAHGAIIGSAFGIPSICIGIEPKLMQVAQMFPRTARFLNLPLTFKDLYDNIISGLTIPGDRVLKDFEENKKILVNSLIEAEKYLQKHEELDKTGNAR
jgi:polysaccharide pyruvyl transferase WcaK-like protein